MKQTILKLLLVNYFFVQCAAQAPPRLTCAVTHGLPIGRAGDYLLWYIKAKYVAHKCNIPLLLNAPRDHLVKLGLDRLELCRKETLLTDHLYVVDRLAPIKSEDDIISSKGHFFVVEYDFCSKAWGFKEDIQSTDVSLWHNVMCDHELRDKLRAMIALPPEAMPTKLLPPVDQISVAMHIRTGDAWDPENNKITWYYKFPHIDFYVDALHSIAQLVKPMNLFVHIFTDHLDPSRLLKEIMQKIQISNVRFRCRSRGNSPMQMVIEDLIAMAHYDCLIRSMSGFTQVAQLIGDYKIVVYPQKFDGRNVTQIETIKKPNFKELFQQEKKIS